MLLAPPRPSKRPGPAGSFPGPDLASLFSDPDLASPVLAPDTASPVPDPVAPALEPKRERTHIAAQPDAIETWYSSPQRRGRQQRRWAIAVVLITTAIGACAAVGLWRASATQDGRPRPHSATHALDLGPRTDVPRSVIIQARARQHRRRKRIARVFAATAGAAVGWEMAGGTHSRLWLHNTSPGGSPGGYYKPNDRRRSPHGTHVWVPNTSVNTSRLGLKQRSTIAAGPS